MTITEGDRVRLRRDVERYPHFIAPAGATGTVVDIVGDLRLVAVRMDEPLPGAEEWDNEIHWDQESGHDDVRADVEVIA